MISSKELKSSPRYEVLDILTKTLQGQDLQSVLNPVLHRSCLNPRDKSLVTKLCYEYLRLKGRMDFILSRLIKRNLRRLPFSLTLSMGICAYEILYMEKVPDYASVHWYVEYIKKEISSRFTGLANAVLREISRNAGQMREAEFYKADNPKNEVFLSRYYSCPQWIVRIWSTSYGDDVCLCLLKDSLRPPAVGIRVNPSMPEAAELKNNLSSDPELLSGLEHALAFDKTPSFNLVHLEEQGLITRQSIGVLQALQAVDPLSWVCPVWDACAGHGGKAGALMEMGVERLWASDREWKKMLDCRNELDRLQFNLPAFFTAQADTQPPLKVKPGTILLDVPCSGLGVISRRPDIKYKRKPNHIRSLIRLQTAMLQNACSFLPKGGMVVYLTCTLNPEENQDQVTALLRSRANMKLLKQWQSEACNTWREYFYVAKLRKD